MEVAEMVLGKVNKGLVQLVESLGVRAIGLSGKDGGLLRAQKKFSDGKDIGFVGEVTSVDANVLLDLLEKDFLPIICPIGLGEDYQTYNINADDAACAIAQAVHAEKLAFLSDVEGIYTDPADASTLISELTIQEGKQLIEKGTITGGMIPKLYSCIEAIQAGVSRVHILDGRIPHCLLLEIFTNRGIGTAIFEGRKEQILLWTRQSVRRKALSYIPIIDMILCWKKETALTCMIQMEKPIWILARGLVSVLLDM